MENPVIPSMWREAMLHPLTVHFPIAFLILATGLELILLLPFLSADHPLRSNLRFVIRFLLIIGVPAAWLAVFTGDFVHGDVNRVICDPTVTAQHESTALWSAYLFSGALLLSLSKLIRAPRILYKKQIVESFLTVVYCLLMFLGAGALSYAGHLGASLVYQQGAGVYHPTPECKEFE